MASDRIQNTTADPRLLKKQAKALHESEDSEARGMAEKTRNIKEYEDANGSLDGQKSVMGLSEPTKAAPDATAAYGTRSGEKRLDDQGNVIDSTTPSGMGVRGPQMPVPAALYDRGGTALPKINLNDGTHFPAILERGERVLNPSETKNYDRAHPNARKEPMKAKLYDKGGMIPMIKDVNQQNDPMLESVNMNQIPLMDDGGETEPLPTDRRALPTIDLSPSQQDEQRLINEKRDQLTAKKAQAMDKGSNGLMDLGTANLHERALDKHEEKLAEGAPVDFSGQVMSNPRGVIVQSDTDQPNIGQRLSGGATMQTRNAPLSIPKMDASNPPGNDMTPGVMREASAKMPVIETPMGNGTTDVPQTETERHEASARNAGLTVQHQAPIPTIPTIEPLPASNRENAPLTEGVGPDKTAPAAGGLIPPQSPKDAYKAHQQDLDKRIEAARDASVDANATPAERASSRTLADELTQRKSELKRPAATSLLGKIGRGLETAGNIAGNLVGAPEMSLIPGTALYKQRQAQGTLGRINTDVAQEKTLAETDAAKSGKESYEYQKDDQGNLWRLSKNTSVPAQMVTFGPQGQPQLVNPPAGVTPPTLTAGARPTFGSEKGANAPAKDEQVAEYAKQMPTLAPALTAGEREAYGFLAGYKPTVKEIQDNKAELSKANAAKLSGKREDIANANATAANNKRTMEEKLVEQVAQDIAPMNVDSLSALKNITSMRSDQRVMIYARAKEINPKFNTAEVDRKVKMLDNFTNNKEGTQLQSFGTFLDHAGYAVEATSTMRSENQIKLLNTPINKIEKEFGGTTANEYAAVLEPVRKEAESFLLGGRALYADDRKAADTIINDGSSPAQIEAAITRLSHVVGARFNEMDTRFKNTMGQNLQTVFPDLISDDAKRSAEKFGVTLGSDKEKKFTPKNTEKPNVPKGSTQEVRDASGKVIGYK